MPRGGARGGGGSWRGRARPGTARIAGVDIEIEDGIDTSNTLRPARLFPERQLVKPRAPTKEELALIRISKQYREAMYNDPDSGDIHTNSGINKATTDQSQASNFDPFEQSVETFSLKYTAPKEEAIPKLRQRKYELKMFPERLRGFLDPTYDARKCKIRMQAKMKAKKAELRLKQKKRLDARAKQESSGISSTARIKIDEDDANDEGSASDQEPSDPVDEPDDTLNDEHFEEDGDDMAGDYNAEQYFDNGGDDAGDDYDAGLEGGEMD